VVGRIGRLLERVTVRSGDSWTKPDRATGDAVVTVLAQASCRVCASILEGEQRGANMLVAMLIDARVRAAFAAGHGVCLRHAHAWTDPTTVQLVRETTRTRLSESSWELEEARQKSVWWNRYESRGAESIGWRRAPELLDSWVYLGIGAPRPVGS
jgi:hypothetical protein